MKKVRTFRYLIVSLLLVSYAAFGQYSAEHVVNLTSSFKESPPSMSFIWEPIAFDSSIYVYRKAMTDTAWGEPMAILPSNATEFNDNTVEIEVEYEYAIREDGDQEVTWAGVIPTVTYVSAGIELPETEYRGKIILLVDSSFIDSLKFELSRFETDLFGDGWEVLRKDVSRNTSVKYIKSVVRDIYSTDTANIKSLILFGHIPVPYSGCYSIDGHADHIGAQPADLYYGCMKEERWTDTCATCTSAKWSRNYNVIGDGKFDLDEIPADDEVVLQIGRIDLCDLPAFSESESELLGRYLNKDHAFRHRMINPEQNALIVKKVGDPAFSIETFRYFTALFNASGVKHSDGFFPTAIRERSYIWSSVETAGDFDALVSASTNTFTEHEAKTVFTAMTGSWNWDWDSKNNVLRASLASKGWILTNGNPWGPYAPMHRMAMGRTIGHGFQAQMNEQYLYQTLLQNFYPLKWLAASLLGDPTLRMHIVCPVNSLQSAITADNAILLAWKPADDYQLRYIVYKLDTLSGKYDRITTSPVTDTWFEDTSPLPGNNYYMVKSYQLTQSASGSYYNLSQGVFDTLKYAAQEPVPVTGIELSADPDNILPLLVYEPFSVTAHVLPENATNKLLKWSFLGATANSRLDVNGDILCDHGGTLILIAEALDGSGVTDSLEIFIDSIPDPAGPVSGEIDICRDNNSRLFTIPEARGATGYIWTLPTGEIDTTILSEVNYWINNEAESGTIRVRPVNPFGDGEENMLEISIYDIPPSPLVTFQGFVLHSDAPEGNQWYNGDTLIEGATEQDFTVTEPGVYSTRVTLNNCTSPKSNKITWSMLDVGSTEEQTGILIYPNPVLNEVRIEFTEPLSSAGLIEVLDISGNSLLHQNFSPNKTECSLDLSSFGKGIYLIRIRNNYFSFVEKVIKIE